MMLKKLLVIGVLGTALLSSFSQASTPITSYSQGDWILGVTKEDDGSYIVNQVTGSSGDCLTVLYDRNANPEQYPLAFSRIEETEVKFGKLLETRDSPCIIRVDKGTVFKAQGVSLQGNKQITTIFPIKRQDYKKIIKEMENGNVLRIVYTDYKKEQVLKEISLRGYKKISKKTPAFLNEFPDKERRDQLLLKYNKCLNISDVKQKINCIKPIADRGLDEAELNLARILLFENESNSDELGYAFEYAQKADQKKIPDAKAYLGVLGIIADELEIGEKLLIIASNEGSDAANLFLSALYADKEKPLYNELKSKFYLEKLGKNN